MSVLDSETLEDLMRDCASGDRTALRAIYDAEAGRMIGVAQRLLKRRAAAEDAVHDAFVQIWNHAASFDPARGNARTWIYAVLRHRALNMIRSEKRIESRENPESSETASEDDDPETIVAKLSDVSRLQHCLQGLDAQRRSAIVLAYVHGLTHVDLAARLDMPLGTVKSWLRRSLLSLRECMG